MKSGLITNIVVLSLILLPVETVFMQTPPVAKSVLTGDPFNQVVDSGPVLTLAETIDLALKQASN